MAHLAIFGGTGFLGARIVRQLLNDGHKVRIVARTPDPSVETTEALTTVQADLLSPDTLPPALDGMDGAVNAVSLYIERGDITFDSVHVDGAARLAAAAKQAGLSRFVQVSGIGADATAQDAFIRARGRGEEAVREACPFATIVRPSVMVGAEDPIRTTILGATRFQPVFPLFGAGETRLQPVHRDDVAAAIATLLTSSDTPRSLYELGGPEIFAYRDLVRRIARSGGRPVWPLPVPFAAWEGLASLAERLPNAPLTRAQVALMRKDNVADPALPGFGDLGITPRPIIDDLPS